MPIRFHCTNCSQLLGIASRKAGAEINCPKCGSVQTVPRENRVAAADASPAAPAVVPPAPPPGGGSGPSLADLVVYDDLPPEPGLVQASEAGDTATAIAVPQAMAVPVAPSAPRPDAEPGGRPVPSGMILYSRQTFYIQGFLFLILGIMAFGAGYFIGRGNATFDRQIAEEQASKQRVPVEGTLVYDTGAGRIAGDENAVIILLPEGKQPEATLSIQGIRPQDPPPRDNNRSVERIRSLGGAYGRADAQGNFYLVVPDQGRYHVLIISAHAARPGNDDIEEGDLVEMQRYFHLAKELVNRFKYRWTTEEIRIGFGAVAYSFGLDGKK